ncbi:arabinogalactan oligomer / maltooligosaccharide transport system substrate-binding protein [Lachnospiraceae bacterium A10]|nr:arabinogalactan oligomer / maltooligosaccharide transport system substrate-binding protein [Lachnospiraceae bacterium A10]
MRKKLVAMMLLACTVFTATACGNASDSASASESQSSTTGSALFTGELEKNVTIQVLENDTAISEGYFQELIDAFNEAYKDQGIQAVDANMDQYLDLANDGPYGYGPDVLYQANDVIMQYAEGKHILPLPAEDLDCYDQIPESAWEAYQTEVDGTTYTCGVPVNVQAPMLYYRKDLLPEDWETTWDEDSNGIPDMVESWSKMYEYSVLRHTEDSSKYGYMKSLNDMYFSSGFLFSYGAYIFGENNTDPSDIGFAAGEAEKGAQVLSQLASVMNEDCIDDTITTNAYSKLGDGTYFATISTPDVYTTFLEELEKSYEEQGMTEDEAETLAEENLVMTSLPALPASGDLTDGTTETVDSMSMGGVNGYAISSYTEAPNACLEFVKFATSYDMIKTRAEMLGIAPAREDVAEEVGGTSKQIYENLDKGNIILMPSITEVSQIWTPGQTFFIDLAKDAYRPEAEKKYTDLASLKEGLTDMSNQIHEAITTLQ